MGKHQSPINIGKSVVKDLPELKFDYKDVALKVTDTGHSFQVNIVHTNAQGELAVVAVLVRTGKANESLKPVFDNFPPPGTVNMNKLLPEHHGYFTFDGSLTTPPCSENVRWFVLKAPVEASEAQLKEFRARHTHNNRPIQPLNARVIDESKSD